MTKLYKNMAIAIFKPKIVGNKLDSFTVDLQNSDLDRAGCDAIGGEYLMDPVLGQNCIVHVSDVIDGSIQDIVYGRFFTASTAPVTVEKTQQATITKKEKATLRFDCGQDTTDLNVLVTNLESPVTSQHPWYKKAVDLRCFKQPEQPGTWDMHVYTSKGSIHSLFQKDEGKI
jgi:hypothetical protein